MTIRAIETRYAGCHFRSRLEARWSVFFDTLGIPWEYEPQGYELPSGPYLPDFWLPTVEAESPIQGTWFEVKPDAINTPNDSRWHELAEQSGHPVITVFGLPNPGTDPIWGSAQPDGHHMELCFATSGWDNGRAFVKCPACNKVGICFSGWLDRLGCGHTTSRIDGCSHPDLIAAYNAARSARFEHGERG